MKVKLENFIKQANEKHNFYYDYSNSVYINTKVNIEIICPAHGSFTQRPDVHLSGAKCYKCGKEQMAKGRTINFEVALQQAKYIHGDLYDYSHINNYTKTREKYPIVCKQHGIFTQRFDKHIGGRGCPKCGNYNKGVRARIPKEEALLRAIEIHGDRYDYSKFDYQGDNYKATVICKSHGEFDIIPSNHFKGNGCSKCINIYSKAELEIRDFLSSNIDIVHSDRTVMGDKKEVDIFIPSKNIAIEYNGLYYHSDKFQDEKYHLNKTEVCISKGIKLVHIFEDEWVYKKEIVKSRLLNIIGKSEYKIYARNCKIKEINSKEATKFLNDNHLQGTVGAKIRLGLYYNKELVSLMTFGELRKNLGSSKKEGVFELLRFCNKLDTNIVGGASKLLKFFKNNHNVKEIISYADRRWSTGLLYENLNFELVNISRPNYFYIKGNIRENRFKFRKDILVKEGYDKNKTEKEIMKERGYHRIYDCGTLKYSLKT